MKVKILVKTGCEKCKLGKELHQKLSKMNVSCQLLNVDTAEGMAEAMFYGITNTYPYTIVSNGSGGNRHYNSVLQAEREILKCLQESTKEQKTIEKS